MRRLFRRIVGPLYRIGRFKLIIAATLAAGAVATAVWVALAGPPTRAAAIAGSLVAVGSTTGTLVAIYLSSQALSRSDRQLAATRRAIVLGRYPLLVPVHQSVAFPDSGGRLAAHPPAESRFALTSPPASAYAFVADTKDRLFLPVENVGEGPAIRIRATLWCTDGRSGPAAGVSVLGAGRIDVLVATIRARDAELPVEFQAYIHDRAEVPNAYWLELEYRDVFDNARRGMAFFDPRGTGTWHYVHGHEPDPV
jgi:hypothetical protein